MTGPDAATLEGLVTRLQEAADRLRDGGLEPEQAAALVEACAEAASQASAELERLARASAAERNELPPTQDQLV